MTNCTIRKNCINCILAGYCIHLNAKVVNKYEMANPAFIYDALAFAYSLNSKPKEFTLGVELKINKPSRWKKLIHKAYTEYKGRFIGSNGKEEFLNTDLFEVTDEKSFDASPKELSNANKTLCEWLEKWLCSQPETGKKVSFHGNTGERLRIVFTVLRATYPHEAQFWGLRGKAANDNNPQ